MVIVKLSFVRLERNYVDFLKKNVQFYYIISRIHKFSRNIRMFENIDWKFAAIVSLLILLVIALVYVYLSEEAVTKESFIGGYNSNLLSTDSYAAPGENSFAPNGVTSELLEATNGTVQGADEVEDGLAPFTGQQKLVDQTYQSQNGGNLPADLYPQNQLVPQDLLPVDNNSIWAQVNPPGQGDLADKNFLEAGYHIGINTIGQSLRNANYQLRSDPPNPQAKVSPWMQTTIEPDTNRRRFEIGCA